MRIPAILVSGARAAGKSTAILRLLARRPPDARWAVLVNDFGAVSLENASGADQGRVVVREVGGCACCTAQVALRMALIALLRERRFERVIIEASAGAHPAAIVHLLREPGLAPAVELTATLCVVDPGQLVDSRYAESAVYREQIEQAELVLVSKSDVVSAERVEKARGALTALRGERALVDELPDLKVLDALR